MGYLLQKRTCDRAKGVSPYELAEFQTPYFLVAQQQRCFEALRSSCTALRNLMSTALHAVLPRVVLNAVRYNTTMCDDGASLLGLPTICNVDGPFSFTRLSRTKIEYPGSRLAPTVPVFG